jgi:hypothetical protein
VQAEAYRMVTEKALTAAEAQSTAALAAMRGNKKHVVEAKRLMLTGEAFALIGNASLAPLFSVPMGTRNGTLLPQKRHTVTAVTNLMLWCSAELLAPLDFPAL